MAGISAGDLARYLCSSTYRALLSSLRPALYDVRSAFSVGRFVSDLWFQFLLMPYLLFGHLVRGIVVAAYSALIYGGLLLFAAWVAMYSVRAFITPPSWLHAYRLELWYLAAGIVGVAASQFTAKLVQARYLKVRRRQEDDSGS